MKCWLMSLWYSHSYFYSTLVVGNRVDKTLQTSHVVQSIFSVQLCKVQMARGGVNSLFKNIQTSLNNHVSIKMAKLILALAQLH
jgi:hypothetical protein